MQEILWPGDASELLEMVHVSNMKLLSAILLFGAPPGAQSATLTRSTYSDEGCQQSSPRMDCAPIASYTDADAAQHCSNGGLEVSHSAAVCTEQVGTCTSLSNGNDLRFNPQRLEGKSGSSARASFETLMLVRGSSVGRPSKVQCGNYPYLSDDGAGAFVRGP